MSEQHEEARRIWKQRMKEWESSGQTMAEWSRQHDLDYKACLYWKKRYVSNVSRDNFTELSDAKTCIVKIEYNNVSICLESATLKQCLSALIDLRC